MTDPRKREALHGESDRSDELDEFQPRRGKRRLADVNVDQVRAEWKEVCLTVEDVCPRRPAQLERLQRDQLQVGRRDDRGGGERRRSRRDERR